ncbi:MAG: hypothetical protein HQK54_12470, partial [Oligoflexales bacterium]|nr:hypothetical protein [Oligoflexales bacterium]
IDSDFKVQGLMGVVSMGFKWASESGYFIEYSFFRLGRAHIISGLYAERAEEGKGIVRRDLEYSYFSGLVNIRLGKLF